MKRIIAGILLVTVILTTLVACKKRYEPVESTEEEARAVMTLTLGENEYEVRYELYRALFLTYKSEIDGGNADAWSGDEGQKYIDKINERILRELGEIFAVFELCQRIGYDLYSKEVEKQIEEMIRVSVEGGSYGDGYYEGFGGDYDAYLASLSEMYHNYSTSVLMLRYQIGVEALEAHYIGEVVAVGEDGQLTDGAIKYTFDKVRAFYESEASVRVLQTYVPEEISYTPKEMAEEIRLDVIEAAKSGDDAVKIMMINRGTPTAVGELEYGVLVGRHSLSREYRALADAAFDLPPHGVSEVIETYSVLDGRRFYVVYRADKPDEFFEENYAEAVTVYLYDAIGETLATIAGELTKGVGYADAYGEINHAEITMP